LRRLIRARKNVRCVHDASNNLPLTGYFSPVFWLNLGQFRRAPTEFFHFLGETFVFHWARRSVGPEQFRAFVKPDRNSHRCAQTAAISAPSTAVCSTSARKANAELQEVKPTAASKLGVTGPALRVNDAWRIRSDCVPIELALREDSRVG
jgi:hypothetical protein